MWQFFVCRINSLCVSVQKSKIKTFFTALIFTRRLFNKNTESAEILPQCLLLNSGQQSFGTGLAIGFAALSLRKKSISKFALTSLRDWLSTFSYLNDFSRGGRVSDAELQLRWQPIELDRLYTIAYIVNTQTKLKIQIRSQL